MEISVIKAGSVSKIGELFSESCQCLDLTHITKLFHMAVKHLAVLVNFSE